ncbi:MAG: hypothetical protein ACRDV2_00960, partial [Actinomycetes bacterium]
MTLVVLAVLAPFVAALAGFLLGGRWPRLVVPVAVGGTGVALVATAGLAVRAVLDAPLADRLHVATV